MEENQIKDAVEKESTPIQRSIDAMLSGEPLSSEEAERVIGHLRDLSMLVEVQPCRSYREEPYDFGCCETHDRTFALGATCDHAGLSELDWIDGRESEQRGRAVIAEGKLEDAQYDLDAIRALAMGSESVPSSKILDLLEDGS